jgi:hypothetical protein
MKFSQEQIEEALQYADDMLLDCEIVILATAYRELLEKNQELTKKLDKWESFDYVGGSPY